MRINGRNHLAWGASAALTFSLLATTAGFADDKSKDSDAADAVKSESPIKHVIILIGENRGTDHTFGVYKPRGRHQTISNILSKGIVNEDGMPGPNYGLAQQFSVTAQPSFYVGVPDSSKTPYNTSTNLMPQPNTSGAPTAAPPATTSAPITRAPR